MKKSKNILQNILQKLELGETLVSICRDKGMPGQSTVNTWMREDDKFKDKVFCHIMGWVCDSEMKDRLKTDGQFSGAYVTSNSELHPFPNMKWEL